jgi:hypothetical protein
MGTKTETSLSSDPVEINEAEEVRGKASLHGTEEWEGGISWGTEKKTVTQSLKKIDLASLIDWGE